MKYGVDGMVTGNLSGFTFVQIFVNAKRIQKNRLHSLIAVQAVLM